MWIKSLNKKITWVVKNQKDETHEATSAQVLKNVIGGGGNNRNETQPTSPKKYIGRKAW
jgi:hypothetical protein